MHQIVINSALKDNIKDLDLENFFTFSYCILDEIYQNLKHYVKGKRQQPVFSDREVICFSNEIKSFKPLLD